LARYSVVKELGHGFGQVRIYPAASELSTGGWGKYVRLAQNEEAATRATHDVPKPVPTTIKKGQREYSPALLITGRGDTLIRQFE
jgi:hypothetical protein